MLLLKECISPHIMKTSYIDVVARGIQWTETTALLIETRGGPSTCRSGLMYPAITAKFQMFWNRNIATPARIPIMYN